VILRAPIPATPRSTKGAFVGNAVGTFRSGIGPPVGGSGVLTMVSASDSSSISSLAAPHRGEGPARLSDILRLVRRSHISDPREWTTCVIPAAACDVNFPQRVGFDEHP